MYIYRFPSFEKIIVNTFAKTFVKAFTLRNFGGAPRALLQGATSIRHVANVFAKVFANVFADVSAYVFAKVFVKCIYMSTSCIAISIVYSLTKARSGKFCIWLEYKTAASELVILKTYEI